MILPKSILPKEDPLKAVSFAARTSVLADFSMERSIVIYFRQRVKEVKDSIELHAIFFRFTGFHPLRTLEQCVMIFMEHLLFQP